ncbi:elongin-B-like [Nycticebus coucang]|uniref:elongin-B-like n=1 Tax=Nycticebus coucang TaxID=9470 RepID=UPI00234CD514|nr:elongin-B-like [Nycticebus coucang]
MDVFLMIRRHKTTIFTDAKESSTVFELKRIVEGILKRPAQGAATVQDDAFEALRIKPFSSPPELPDVMKPQDSGSSANEQAVQ